MTKQEKREKVIKGLEWCLFKTGCNGCPYRNDCDDGEQMERDALALLKAQEPRVMTIGDLYGNDWFCADGERDIDNAPTIDAIPIEYLMKYAQLPTEFAIAAWQKQDKDAQKKQIKRLDKPMSFDDALNLVNEVFPLGQQEQEDE